MKTFRKFLRRQNGTALIETALIVPIFTLLLMGAADFSILLNYYLRLVDSARAEAMVGTIRAYTTNPSILNLVGEYSGIGIPNYSVSATNYCTCANGASIVSCSSHQNCGNYGIPNQYLKVTATASLPLIFGVSGFPARINVQSVAIARTAWTGTN